LRKALGWRHQQNTAERETGEMLPLILHFVLLKPHKQGNDDVVDNTRMLV
jgi:hypothetical protein